MNILISIEKLLSGKFVEGARMEFKTGWNPVSTMRTICAFANDFGNEGSGYIIIGVEEENGRAKRPVKGFNPNEFERIQKELIAYCNLIQPTFFPRLSLEEIDAKHVLVIWVPAGSNRPYKVPDDVTARHKTYNFRIRQFSSSIVPNTEQEAELLQLTAKIPFDDRVNSSARVDDLSFVLMREHLSQTKSRLYNESAKMSIEDLADAMNLSQGAKEHLFPKNVGLLMFAEEPTAFFNGIQIDVLEFPNGLGAKEFNEKTFTGPIQKQLADALSYLKTNIIKSKVIKYDDTEKADKVYNYPYTVIEEALANAVYHRNYELREPIEVRVLPSSIEIISYSGIDPSLKQSDFEKGVVRTRRYRNRRIGSFLKELGLTEGKGTGIPIIYKALEDNGSPKPIFDIDYPNRNFFVVELPIHFNFMDIVEDIQIDKQKPMVFISYAREDIKMAERIYADLYESGVEPWLDQENILPGDNWELEIEKAIKSSSFFIAILSSNSLSKEGFVQKEMNIALNKLTEKSPSKRYLIPAKIDDCKPQDKRLKNIHHADLCQDYEKGFKQILKAIIPG